MNDVKRYPMLDPKLYNEVHRRDFHYVDVVLASDYEALRAALNEADAQLDFGNTKYAHAAIKQAIRGANLNSGGCPASLTAPSASGVPRIPGATDQPAAGPVYLPKITPEISEDFGDTDLMKFNAGSWGWSGIAVDFAGLLNLHRLQDQTTKSP